MALSKQITAEQKAVIAHVARDMPAMKRAMFEAQVHKTLKQQHQREGDQFELTVLACIAALEMAKEMT